MKDVKEGYFRDAEKLREELGQDSPLAALVEAGPRAMEEAARRLTIPVLVPRDRIDPRVVLEFSRLIKLTALEKGHQLEMVQPFNVYDVLYPEIMEEVWKKTSHGLDYYRTMVKQMPMRFYFKD